MVAEEYKKRRVAGKREARTIISVIAFSLLHLFHYSSTTLLLDDTLLTHLGPLIGERKQSPDTVEQHMEWATSLIQFPADEKLESFSELDEQDNTANTWRSGMLLDSRAGFYLHPSAYGSIYSDTVNLLTPWPVGVSNTHVLGWGNCAFEPSHNLCLSRVLNKWKGLHNFWGLDGEAKWRRRRYRCLEGICLELH